MIADLAAEGIEVVTLADGKLDAPYVLLHPAEQFITLVEQQNMNSMDDCEVSITYELSILAGKAEEDTAYDKLDQLLEKCLLATRYLDDVRVSDVGLAKDSSNALWLAAVVTFSNTIKIEGEEYIWH
ncbi:hypothetical protein HQO26_05295 [Rhodococcus fascians]|nr:hypothetical protein [Rhodococcus fascians]MBY4416273.1 hypothetical protein [Rhodococcus fascians]